MSKMGDFNVWLWEAYPEVDFDEYDIDHMQRYLDEYLEYLKEETE